MQIKIKKVRDGAKIPTCGSEYSAGRDLYACTDKEVTIEPHKTVMIPTGLAMEIPVNYAGLIYARSGLATKRGIGLVNSVGVIDSDYRGEIMITSHNFTDTPQTILPNERIAQLVVTPFLPVDYEEVDELSDTDRGEGGFGSTGRQ